MSDNDYGSLMSIKCPYEDHLLFQARRGLTGHIVIRCRSCKRHVLITDVDHVQKIDPPPGSYRAEFTSVRSKAF